MGNQKFVRRDFFRKIAQMTILSTLVGGSVYLLSENRIQTVGCTSNQFCKNCMKLNSCSLDQAKKFRQDER